MNNRITGAHNKIGHIQGAVLIFLGPVDCPENLTYGRAQDKTRKNEMDNVLLGTDYEWSAMRNISQTGLVL